MSAPTRRRRSDGERTRRTILRTAADLASVEGLEGLSIGSLAAAVGVSKAGLYAHFGSKEELQLATIREATRIVRGEVMAPALAQPEGLPRTWALCREHLRYVERRVFPGGCFFLNAMAECDSRPGPLKQLLADGHRRWLRLLEETVAEAVDAGQLRPGVDIPGLVRDVESMRLAATLWATLHDDPQALARGADSIRARLLADAADPESLIQLFDRGGAPSRTIPVDSA